MSRNCGYSYDNYEIYKLNGTYGKHLLGFKEDWFIQWIQGIYRTVRPWHKQNLFMWIIQTVWNKTKLLQADLNVGLIGFWFNTIKTETNEVHDK